ncbi:hypothetical protein SAMN05216207_10639 [Pseudonocardia ammonioxydans]|uniref:Uncharacterized protein n=1 Tax=Pseudonocardia ammonioxydans TaxID=260086 RepID=A0A1I5HE57_PSUAM|nr:hypothetical protein [Pseudonocardia ammonioxydans]SFO46545.1 hypothetical protein SAMN05216207_10639 [Pseudonocardia ammonioxydans]
MLVDGNNEHVTTSSGRTTVMTSAASDFPSNATLTHVVLEGVLDGTMREITTPADRESGHCLPT